MGHKKAIITLLAVATLTISTHTSIWDDIAKPFKEVGTQIASVARKAGEFFERDVYETALKKYVWEKGLSQLGRIGEIKDAIKNIGKQLMIGSTELKDAPEKLRKGNEKLQTQLVAGIENQIIRKTKNKLALVSAKRDEIARTRAVVEQVGPTLTALGLDALVNDLIQGLQAADAALAVLVDLPPSSISPIVRELVEQTYLKRCPPGSDKRSRDLRHTCPDMKNYGFLKPILCYSSSIYKSAEGCAALDGMQAELVWKRNSETYGFGVLVDLFKTAETAVNTTKDLINKVDSNITTLQNKINRKDFCIQGGLCTLPERMVALGSTLVSFTW